MRDEMHGSCHRCVVGNTKGPLCPDCDEVLREWWTEMAEGIKGMMTVMR